MTKKCIICKVEFSPFSNRSFHMFPKNESSRKNWIDAIKLQKTPNFKTAYICGDHFNEEAYFPIDEQRKKKRLRPEAMPQINNENSCNSSISNEITKLEKMSVHSDEESEEKHVNSEIMVNEVTISQENCEINDSSLQSHSNGGTEENINNLRFANSLGENSQSNRIESNVTKRKFSFDNKKPIKKIRFMTGFITEYVCREDFVSDGGWSRFLRFVAYQRSKLSAAHSKSSRVRKRNLNLKGLINTLQMNRINNNQTTIRYKSPYRKLLPNKINVIISASANCPPSDETLLVSEKNDNTIDEEPASVDIATESRPLETTKENVKNVCINNLSSVKGSGPQSNEYLLSEHNYYTKNVR